MISRPTASAEHETRLVLSAKISRAALENGVDAACVDRHPTFAAGQGKNKLNVANRNLLMPKIGV
jgi:hypothetical protein